MVHGRLEMKENDEYNKYRYTSCQTDLSLVKKTSKTKKPLPITFLHHFFTMSNTHPPPSEEQDQTTRQSPGDDNDDNEYADAEENFKPKTFRFWAIILSVYLAIFLVALDRLIIATAIPSITNEFHSVNDIGWYGSSYMMTCAIFSPLSGRIYQLYPTKWVFLGFITVFEIGSAICGAAPNSGALIGGRTVAGAGAAGIFGGGIQIIMPMVPLRKRPIFTGFFGLAFGVSSVIGPFLGGVFTDNK